MQQSELSIDEMKCHILSILDSRLFIHQPVGSFNFPLPRLLPSNRQMLNRSCSITTQSQNVYYIFPVITIPYTVPIHSPSNLSSSNHFRPLVSVVACCNPSLRVS